MLSSMMTFLQEQAIPVLMGLVVLGSIWVQVMGSIRYRRLRGEIRTLGAMVTGKNPETAEDRKEKAPVTVHKTVQKRTKKKLLRREETAPAAAEYHTTPKEAYTEEQEWTTTAESPEAVQKEPDSQLLYLKQSLDRIAAGRDQRMEEPAKVRRKLTPEEEGIIADILREYLS